MMTNRYTNPRPSETSRSISARYPGTRIACARGLPMPSSRGTPFAGIPSDTHFFFKPVHLHRQLAYLSLQLSAFEFFILVLRGILAFEEFGIPIKQLLFSITDLYGMHLVLRSNLVEGVEASDRLQSDSCLKFSRVFSSLFSHSSYPSRLWSYTPKPNSTAGPDSQVRLCFVIGVVS